ncbi:RDD family protein [Cytophaga hutchinsonii]|nr:RDD family protein [Cytophaga hutchinsonii]SFX89316.1 Uncharacterized membrane protein YckC, RDD family [Cytophaga hutchinsonii ATCC 33406]
MQQEIIDVLSEEAEADNVVYATFWKRVGATLLDGLILSPVNYGLIFLSMVYYKIYVLAVLSGMVHLVYKLYMEKKYGQTLGKMVVRIKVTGDAFQPLDYAQTLKRNYYYVLSMIFSAIICMNLFSTEAFQHADTYMELMKAQQMQAPVYKYLQYAFSGVFFIDILFMLNDDRKKTVHDRWGNTVVIKKPADM